MPTTFCLTHPLTHPIKPDLANFIAKLDGLGASIIGMPGKTLQLTPATPPPTTLLCPSSPLGWVFTSQHGAEGLFLAIKQQALTVQAPAPDHLLTLGTAAQRILTLHYWQPKSDLPPFPNSQTLAEWLIAACTDPARSPSLPHQWVWPCGTQRMETWLTQIQCQAPQLRIHPWQVYTSTPIAALSEVQDQALSSSNGLIITSPGHLLGLLNAKANLPENLFAIGPTTAQAIAHHCNRPATAIAPQPTWAALAQLLAQWLAL